MKNLVLALVALAVVLGADFVLSGIDTGETYSCGGAGVGGGVPACPVAR